jgi:ABC-type polysaccharide/polyol phosphate transport system ATPase subunit
VTATVSGVEPTIELEGVGKRYIRMAEQAMLLRSLLPFRKPLQTELWAMRDLSLRIEPGETVGSLGHNGAGTTTLLRLLAGVTAPTEGIVTVRGRIAPLISVGVGFHRELSGRENVYVNGMLLGLTKRQIDARFNDIVDFAELHDAIDTPVKFYSSGMFMRLGFAVAIHVDPQVMLVDEVLAVGDAAFQFKCIERMKALQAGGTTIVLVSHSLPAIQLLCPRVLVVDSGRVVVDGDVATAVAAYHELLAKGSSDGEDGGPVRVLSSQLIGSHGATTTVDRHEAVRLRQRIRFEADLDSPQVRFCVDSSSGLTVYTLVPRVGLPYRQFRAGEEAEVEIPFVTNLVGGTYRAYLHITSNDGQTVLHADQGLVFNVQPRLGSLGVAELDATAHVDGHDVSDPGELRLGVAPGTAQPAAHVR